MPGAGCGVWGQRGSCFAERRAAAAESWAVAESTVCPGRLSWSALCVTGGVRGEPAAALCHSAEMHSAVTGGFLCTWNSFPGVHCLTWDALCPSR